MCTWWSHAPRTNSTTWITWHSTTREATYHTHELYRTVSRPMTRYLARSLLVLVFVPSSPRKFCELGVCFVFYSFLLEFLFFSKTCPVSASLGCLLDILEILDFEERWSQHAFSFCPQRHLRRALRTSGGGGGGGGSRWSARLLLRPQSFALCSHWYMTNILSSPTHRCIRMLSNDRYTALVFLFVHLFM